MIVKIKGRGAVRKRRRREEGSAMPPEGSRSSFRSVAARHNSTLHNLLSQTHIGKRAHKHTHTHTHTHVDTHTNTHIAVNTHAHTNVVTYSLLLMNNIQIQEIQNVLR